MSEGIAAPLKKRPYKKRWAITIVAVLLLLAVIIITLLWQPWKRSAETLPKDVTAHITSFEVYYFSTEIPGDFTLKEGSVTYNSGVLLFQLQNKSRNQTISVSEQVLPAKLAGETYADANKVAGADGSAMIDYVGTKILGSLFSKEHAGVKTLILLNSTDSIPKSTMEELLRGLRPIGQQAR